MDKNSRILHAGDDEFFQFETIDDRIIYVRKKHIEMIEVFIDGPHRITSAVGERLILIKRSSL